MRLFLFVLALALITAIAFAPAITRLVRGPVARRTALAGLGRLAIVLAILGFVLVPVMAFAQAAVVAGPEAAPSASSYLFGGLATVLTLAIVYALHRWLGIQLDAKAQADLHRAAETGAKALAARLGVDVSIDSAVSRVERYMLRSVPGAIDRLNPPSDVLANVITSKLPSTLIPKTTGL